MKIRLYFNDFLLYADIEWQTSFKPNDGDLIFLKDLINLQENNSNVTQIEPEEGSHNQFLSVKVYRGRDRTRKNCYFLMNTPCVMVDSSTIFRMINGELIQCYLVKPDSNYDIKDAICKVSNEDAAM